jgi:phage terminase large subunit GpA-like protein
MSMAVDSGGMHTHEVYYYCRQHAPKAMAIKGSKGFNDPLVRQNPKPQDITIDGGVIKSGVLLWNVGVSYAKKTLYNRLKIETPGPNYIHFHAGLDDEFYMQLTAEKLVTRVKKGYREFEWIKTRDRNDFLDCWNYAYAAAHRLGILNIGWQKAERTRRRPRVHKKATELKRMGRKPRAW